MKILKRQLIKRLICRNIMDEPKSKKQQTCQRGFSSAPCHKPATQFHWRTGRLFCDECAKIQKPIYMRPLPTGEHVESNRENRMESA